MKWTPEMSEEQRLERIAELLSKGITLMLMREAKASCAPVRIEAESLAGDDQDRQDIFLSSSIQIDVDDIERRILDYLARVGEASPRQIQAYMSLSRATANRRLTRLVKERLLARGGKTAAARYRICGGLNANTDFTVSSARNSRFENIGGA